MKRLKRCLAMVLVFCIIVSLMPTNTVYASSATKAKTVDDVVSMLASWKNKLNDKYWNYYNRETWDGRRSQVEAKLKSVVDNGILNKSNPSNDELGVTITACSGDFYPDGCRSNYFSIGWQCFGFAWWIEYALFQSTYQYNPSDWYVYSGSDLNSISLQPGDYIRLGDHSAVVSNVTGGALNCVEAYGGLGCKISWSSGFNGSKYTTTAAMLNAIKNNGGTVYRYKHLENGSSTAESYVDLGTNFYAYIEHQSTELYLTNQDYDIIGNNQTGDLTQIWYFERQDNGAYVISSAYDNACFDVLGESQEDGATVYAYAGGFVGGLNQQFYIYDMYDAYYFKPAHCTRNVMLDMNTSTHNLELWYAGEDWEPQEFSIHKIVQVNNTFPENIGSDFYAYIGHQSTGKRLTNQLYNIAGETPREDSTQVWKFSRLNNGAYVIESAYDNACFDVLGMSDVSGTNVYAYAGGYVGGANQQFYIYHVFDAYYFKPAHCTRNVMLDMNTSTYNLELWYAGENWEPQEFNIDVVKHNIVYNAQGGTISSSIQTKGYNESILLQSQIPVKTSYTFVEWNTKVDGSGESYLPGAMYSDNASITLYAQWRANEHTITYNANGGTGAPASQTKAYGEELTLSSTIPTRTGYTFLGWATSSDAASATYAAGASFTKNANTTLYAVWKADEYTITYDANGGTGIPENQVKIHDVELTLSEIVPTRTNYTFLGWATSSDAASASYAAGASFTVNENTTLYAVWDKNEYVITYDGTGCTYMGGVLEITAAGTYTIENIDKENAHGDRIVVSAPSGVVNIILDGVLVDTSITTDTPFDITGDCTVNIILADGSYNSLEVGLDRAAIENNSHPLTISCAHATEEAHFCNKTCGELRAVGQGSGAGIGGADGENGENITILGGDITAATVSGNGSAGIGGGFGGNASNITICGGIVNAAGIGAGFGGSAESIYVRPQTGMKIKVTADDAELEGSPFTVEENIAELISGAASVVLREYSALSVIKNTATGDYYESINEAIEDAESGETVQLIEDCSVNLLVIPNGITLDLDGHMLTIAGRMFGSYGNVIDGTVGGEGGLVIAQSDIAILQPDNTFLPIYDTANGCYRFFDYEMGSRGAKAVSGDENAVKYGYTLYFYSVEAYKLLANSAETNLGMTVQLSWTGMNNPLSYTVPTATLASFARTAANQLATKGSVTAAITFTVKGLNNLGSDAVVSSGATITSTTNAAMSSEVTKYDI